MKMRIGENPYATIPPLRGHTNVPRASNTYSARHLRPCGLPIGCDEVSGLKDGDRRIGHVGWAR